MEQPVLSVLEQHHFVLFHFSKAKRRLEHDIEAKSTFILNFILDVKKKEKEKREIFHPRHLAND